MDLMKRSNGPTSRWKRIGPRVETPWPEPEADERLLHALDVILRSLLRLRAGSSACAPQFGELLVQADKLSRSTRIRSPRPAVNLSTVAAALIEDERSFVEGRRRPLAVELLCLALQRSRQIRLDHLHRLRSARDAPRSNSKLEVGVSKEWNAMMQESRGGDWHSLLDEVIEVVQRQAAAVAALSRAAE